MPPLNLIGDYAGGSMFLVAGILAALIERQQSGKGQVIDSAITDGSAHLMSIFHTLDKLGGFAGQRESNLLDGGVPFYGAYQTLDNKFVSVAPIEPQFFAEMLEKTGLPESFSIDQHNPKKWSEIKTALTEKFRSKTRDQWAEIFEGSDACVTGIYDVHEAPNHPHNKSRGTYLTIDGSVQPAPAPRFSRSSTEVPESPSQEGADTTDVLTDFGFSASQIDELDQAGALT